MRIKKTAESALEAQREILKIRSFPRRGEVWVVNWNPASGSQHGGRRPAAIIQDDIGNEKALTTIVAAVSTAIKPYPMNVEITPPEGG